MKNVKFKSNKAQVMQRHERNVQNFLTEFGMKQQELAKKEIDMMGAVETGLMRVSNEFEVGKRQVRFGNTTLYGIFVTMGTRFMQARPFLQRSVFAYKQVYRNLANKYLGRTK